MASPWDDPARVEQLKALYALNLSSALIAERMGGGLTRNSVIGKLHRLGIARPTTAAARSQGSKIVRKQRRPKRRFRFPDSAKTAAQAADEAAHAAKIKAEFEAIIAAGEPNIPPHERRTLLVRKPDGKLYANETLGEKACRWVYGGPGAYHFCGEHKVPGLSYCQSHARRAFAGRGNAADHPRYIQAIRGLRLMDRTRGLDGWDEMAEKEGGFRVKEKA